MHCTPVQYIVIPLHIALHLILASSLLKCTAWYAINAAVNIAAVATVTSELIGLNSFFS